MKKTKKKTVAADDPLAGDLSGQISRAQFTRMRFVLEPKSATVTLRLPQTLLDTAKVVAKKNGVKYQGMMREAIAEYVARRMG